VPLKPWWTVEWPILKPQTGRFAPARFWVPAQTDAEIARRRAKEQMDATELVSEVMAERFSRAAELLWQLNERADMRAAIGGISVTTFDRPHIWRGNSSPTEPSGVWLDPCDSDGQKVLEVSLEFKEILLAKYRA
jgi:hypothetical protein